MAETIVKIVLVSMTAMIVYAVWHGIINGEGE